MSDKQFNFITAHTVILMIMLKACAAPASDFRTNNRNGEQCAIKSPDSLLKCKYSFPLRQAADQGKRVCSGI